MTTKHVEMYVKCKSLIISVLNVFVLIARGPNYWMTLMFSLILIEVLLKR